MCDMVDRIWIKKLKKSSEKKKKLPKVKRKQLHSRNISISSEREISRRERNSKQRGRRLKCPNQIRIKITIDTIYLINQAALMIFLTNSWAGRVRKRERDNNFMCCLLVCILLSSRQTTLPPFLFACIVVLSIYLSSHRRWKILLN